MSKCAGRPQSWTLRAGRRRGSSNPAPPLTTSCATDEKTAQRKQSEPLTAPTPHPITPAGGTQRTESMGAGTPGALTSPPARSNKASPASRRWLSQVAGVSRGCHLAALLCLLLFWVCSAFCEMSIQSVRRSIHPNLLMSPSYHPTATPPCETQSG